MSVFDCYRDICSAHLDLFRDVLHRLLVRDRVTNADTENQYEIASTSN